VRIEGISYVQNYRNQFNAEIKAKGIDAVIARLQADAAKLESGAGAPAARLRCPVRLPNDPAGAAF
jgi:hypothetical protein